MSADAGVEIYDMFPMQCVAFSPQTRKALSQVLMSALLGDFTQDTAPLLHINTDECDTMYRHLTAHK